MKFQLKVIFESETKDSASVKLSFQLDTTLCDKVCQ